MGVADTIQIAERMDDRSRRRIDQINEQIPIEQLLVDLGYEVYAEGRPQPVRCVWGRVGHRNILRLEGAIK